MAIEFTTTVEDDTLVVKACGFDERLEQVQQYGMDIIQACLQQQVSRVLCDECDLEYRLSTFDTYAAAEFIAENAPLIAKVAIVCNPAFIKDALFWETVAVNRGLTIQVFKDIDAARRWLKPA